MDIRVFLANDHMAIRRALHDLLDAEVNLTIVGETANGLEVVEQTRYIRPDVVVLDDSMPGITGVEAARQIGEHSPETQVILLSMHASREHALQALRAGANGYVLKESAGSELVNAIRTVLDGSVYLSPEITQLVGDYA
jgi:DNA-binding NarL/FixJ family response regulator